MKVNVARFYKRERFELDCEIITPMFLGNANQEAELRAAPFKGLLRYWWRVANGSKWGTSGPLLEAENDIFGSADADSGGRSQVTVEVEAVSNMLSKKDNFRNPGMISHPECEKSKYKTNPLNYLAGMGLVHFKNGVVHSYFPSGNHFRFVITVGSKFVEEFGTVIGLLHKFGAIGSRSRNGWGCFSFEKQNEFNAPVLEFTNAFSHDYPHCLGKDSTGDLFWKTKQSQESWEDCMKDLADAYVSIRAGNAKKNIQKLTINSGSRPDRHLLGYPVTNHTLALTNWNKNGRHGSALRLLVRKEGTEYRGYILHLPHLFSKEMWPESEKERQINIWQTVHKNLDTLCERVSYQETAQ